MWSCAGYADNKEWKRMVHLMETSNMEILSDELQQEVIKNCGSEFVGWLLFHVNNIGSNGRSQVFYITYTAQYFGLSRAGIEVLSKYGYGVTLDMYDNMRRDYLLKATELKRFIYI